MNGTNYNILCVPKTCWTTSITRHDTKYLSEMPHNKKPPPQRCGLHLTLKNPTLPKPSCCQPAEPPSRLLSGAESPIPALPPPRITTSKLRVAMPRSSPQADRDRMSGARRRRYWFPKPSNVTRRAAGSSPRPQFTIAGPLLCASRVRKSAAKHVEASHGTGLRRSLTFV
jgi:hypothetical protein